MPFDERTDWRDTPSAPPPPGSTPVHASDILRWERGIAEAHEELGGKLSKEDADATYVRDEDLSAELDSRDLVSGDDTRIGQSLEHPSFAFALRDTAGRVALGISKDGTVNAPLLALPTGSVSMDKLATDAKQGLAQPMPDYRNLSGITDGVRLSELVVNGAGEVPAWSAKRIVSRGVPGIESAVAKPQIAAWGDSITENDWLGALAGLLGGITTYNGGWTSQTAPEIAARSGATRTMLTFPSDTVPASGATTVTVASANPVGGNIVAGRSRAGWLSTVGGKVPGSLSRDANGTYFTRTTAGSAITLTGAVAWVPDDGATRRDWTQIIWAGRNGPTIAGNVDAIKAIVDYQTAGVKRYLVLEVLPWAGTDGDEKPLNVQLATTFAENYVPIGHWLRTAEAATAAGITFTTDDQTDITNGLTPRSFRVDDVHLNAAGRTAVAYRLHQELKTRGWF